MAKQASPSRAHKRHQSLYLVARAAADTGLAGGTNGEPIPVVKVQYHGKWTNGRDEIFDAYMEPALALELSELLARKALEAGITPA